MEKKGFVKIISSHNRNIVFNYRKGKVVKEVSIAGKMPKQKTNALSYISVADYEELIKMENKQPSAFALLLDAGESGKEGLTAFEMSFDELPGDQQLKFDPERHAKIKAAQKAASLQMARELEAK
jgi:hypothetical protein